MPTPNGTRIIINELIGCLVEKGLADAQHYAYLEDIGDGVQQVTFHGAKQVSVALRDRRYHDVYERLVEARAYNVKMLDGALIQMTYRFGAGELTYHRLAFFSAPHLEEFQNNPEIYLTDEMYADVVDRNVVPVPLRFDYDAAAGAERAATHPLSHLTLGQYRNCRIPVSAPVTPFRFIEFILRSFYHRAFTIHAPAMPAASEAFEATIRPRERRLLHLVVPG